MKNLAFGLWIWTALFLINENTAFSEQTADSRHDVITGPTYVGNTAYGKKTWKWTFGKEIPIPPGGHTNHSVMMQYLYADGSIGQGGGLSAPGCPSLQSPILLQKTVFSPAPNGEYYFRCAVDSVYAAEKKVQGVDRIGVRVCTKQSVLPWNPEKHCKDLLFPNQ